VLAVLFGPGVVRGSNEVTGREPEGKRTAVLFEGASDDDAPGPTRRGRARARVTLVGLPLGASDQPNDIELSGSRQRVRCSEGLG
jgi:hypothetical protein